MSIQCELLQDRRWSETKVSYILSEAGALKDLHARLRGAVVIRDAGCRVITDLVLVPVEIFASTVSSQFFCLGCGKS